MQNTIDQVQNVQQYVFLIFDELSPVSSSSSTSNQILMAQISKYGRKIIELSQHSTFKYRNQHFLARSEVENQLTAIHRLVTGQMSNFSYQQSIRSITQKLEQQRKSIWMRYSLPQSRLIPQSGEKSTERQKKQVLEQQKNSMKVSRTKSKGVNRSSTVKQVLKLKGYFENEQNIIRQFYEKVNKHLGIHKVPVSSLDPDNLKYSRSYDENSCQNILDVVKCSTQNNSKHLSNICSLVELLHDNLNKRLKNEGLANSKLEAYFSEVKRMEEVYSYTLSKMLQNLSATKRMIETEASLCLPHIQTLQDITRKLYSLFPTSQSMYQLNIPYGGVKEYRSYGVQANLTKFLNEKKAGSETYRLQVRVGELLERFEKNMKFKKNIDPKQVEKLFQSVREMIPASKNPTQQDLNYEQQFKKLLQLQQKRQVQLNESNTKKVKKLQKKIQEIQQSIEQNKKETVKLIEGWQQQKKKLNKKIDHQQHQYKKLLNQKSSLQTNITEMLKEIEVMREAVRRQNNEQSFRKIQFQKQRDQINRQHENSLKELNKSMQQLKSQRNRMNDQRSIYRQKIELVQAQLQQQKQLSAGLRIELENVIGQNSKYQQQVNQMRKLYEQKIKEVQETIENIRELQLIKQNQEDNITRLNKHLESAEKKIDNFGDLMRDYQRKIEELNRDKQKFQEEVEHWKQEGKLTDTDLKILKDEVEKVNNAYLQSQELIESLKKELAISEEQKEKLFKEKLKLSRKVEQVETQNSYLKNRLQAIELSERDMKDEYYQKCQQINIMTRDIEELKKENIKIRRDQHQERQQKNKIQKELRQVRQQAQSRRQIQSAEQGKRRLQIENMRVQLRRKTQQLQKQKQSYEQKISVMIQKMKEMEECMGQKQLLTRLLQHQSQ